LKTNRRATVLTVFDPAQRYRRDRFGMTPIIVMAGPSSSLDLRQAQGEGRKKSLILVRTLPLRTVDG
jgi:hypothetical protein